MIVTQRKPVGVRPDYRCPECKADVGAPGPDQRARCPRCDQLLTLVKVIGNGVVFLHYRRK